MFNSIFDELKEVKYFTRNNRFQESFHVKYFKEIKRLKSLQVKAVSYLQPKRAYMTELFCEYSKVLTIFAIKAGIQKYCNFQGEAKVEQVIAIATKNWKGIEKQFGYYQRSL